MKNVWNKLVLYLCAGNFCDGISTTYTDDKNELNRNRKAVLVEAETALVMKCNVDGKYISFHRFMSAYKTETMFLSVDTSTSFLDEGWSSFVEKDEQRPFSDVLSTTLTITKTAVSLADSGTYSCRDRSAIDQTYFDVFVWRKEDINISMPETLEYNNGGSAYLGSCAIFNRGRDINVDWFLDGHRVDGLATTGTLEGQLVKDLEVQASSSIHGKRYYCQMDWQGRVFFTSPLSDELRVQSPPYATQISIYASNSSSEFFVESYLSGSSRLFAECTSSGFPSPAVNWITRPANWEETESPGLLRTKDNATAEHAGLFICEASNPLGSLKANTTVDIPYRDSLIDPVSNLLLVLLCSLSVTILVILLAAAKFLLHKYELQRRSFFSTSSTHLQHEVSEKKEIKKEYLL